MSYYTSRSESFVGTRREPACDSHGLWAPAGWEVVPCAGPVAFVWLHSGPGDAEAVACVAYLDRIRELGLRVSPRLGYEHALYRGADGVWLLRDDAVPWPEDRLT